MSEEEEIVCENCGKKLSESVIKYLQENPNAFDGKKLCYKCQKEFTKQQSKDRKLKRTFGDTLEEGKKNLKSLEIPRKLFGDGDVVQIFGDSRIGKSKLAVQLAKEAMMKGDRLLYIDTERNLSEKDRLMLKDNYVVCLDIVALKDLIYNLDDDIDIVILDSIGMPVLITFAEMSTKERGEALLMMSAIFGRLKKWCFKTGGFAIVTNQTKSEMSAGISGGRNQKKKLEDLPPFGDKTKYIAKNILFMGLVERGINLTHSQLRAWGCRDLAKGTTVADIYITNEGTRVEWNTNLLQE